jgi:hypothetical protein
MRKEVLCLLFLILGIIFISVAFIKGGFFYLLIILGIISMIISYFFTDEEIEKRRIKKEKNDISSN